MKKSNKNNRLTEAHKIAKATRYNFLSYREAFINALHNIDSGISFKNRIQKRKPIISVFIKADGTTRHMIGITGIRYKVKGTGHRISTKIEAVRVFDFQKWAWRTMPTDYRLLEIKQTWNIFQLLFT